MSSFTFAPNQYPQQQQQQQREMQKMMRACEGCRRRKIKCDAATTNSWPCSACVRLKLHCVRPNGFDSAGDPTTYEAFVTPDQFHQMTMQMPPQSHQKQEMYPQMPNYTENPAGFYTIPYDPSQAQHDINYTTVPPNMLDPGSYVQQRNFPQPSFNQPGQPGHPGASPESYTTDSYQQQDLADLLGTLKLNEVGTAPYLRNKASFRRGEEPVVEDDEDYGGLPPILSGSGSKIRIPPELMPDEETALQYFELYFTHVHPYVPVLYKPHIYHQWRHARESISPLILEAIFAIGGRLAEEPAMGQQWLGLASRHADAFMDTPRLSTLQALLMILKAREAAPKRGYFFRSWMTVVQCVQMAKDLGLDEHYEDHEDGIDCEHNPTDCHLRTRIWLTVFACEVMVGTPQGRHDLSVSMDTVDFTIPKRMPGADESEYQVSRNFVYFVRIVRNIRTMSTTYARLRKRKDWGIDPEFQELDKTITSYVSDLPADLAISFPADNSPPWLPNSFIGNLHSYHYLTIILYNRPQLSFLDPNANRVAWKQHMLQSYNAAKAICRLQEAIISNFGLSGLQCMQRGFSFTVYAGLSCIVIHLVAIVSPDPDLNSDAREFFTRHMRIMEQVMEVWPMPELQTQIDTVREAFSADTRRAFVLKPSFPYGSPHPSNKSSPPHMPSGAYHGNLGRSGSLDQHLDAHSSLRYVSNPITPPISSDPMSVKNESPAGHLELMPHAATSAATMPPNMGLADHVTWNPSRIFEQWNNTFAVEPPQTNNNSTLGLSPGGSDVTRMSDTHTATSGMVASAQNTSPPPFVPNMANFITPAMWQESVASVYEGGLKRAWDHQ
ncbi:Fungal transcriptional regulatory protein [Cordyceps fumosorosea ARSEF 2679]|uniref:Fungal transcriptional regulatory protein n=1 Tax=Cordyceps fumosorosea (strain ARSEF 2679) TaxID=1081104 RepID=A0A167V632_CORFA|nr:Fungal transcriptional regulatory protein [Cordyceps fumosorosea ARSEF 2679]OAA62264.1 Fungal transcriptional regulatory protein [Cordyceps fumosorosea ARSEF 2679]